MIKIEYSGRFGNNLFQYSWALCQCIENNDSVENPLNTTIIKYKPSNQDRSNIIIQRGFFQDMSVVDKFVENKSLLFNSYDSINGLFVHVRLGDINDNTNRSCSLNYYRGAIRDTGESHGFISSDSPNHKTVNCLKREFNLKPLNRSPEDTIIFGSRFSNKVLSLGTFSWWVGFLGSQKNIIYPDPAKYKIWHGDIFNLEHWNKYVN